MKIKIVKGSERELEVEVDNEDYTLGNLIERELLEDPSVVFAGYKIPHPLKRSLQLVVKTDGTKKPHEALMNAADRAASASREFKQTFEDIVEKYAKKK